MRGACDVEGCSATLCTTESLATPVTLRTDATISTAATSVADCTRLNAVSLLRCAAPSTFTVAEIVRCARASDNLQLASDALAWGMDNMVYLPAGVISDALSWMYSEGQREAVVVLYRELYDRGHITHWAVSSPRKVSISTRQGHQVTQTSAPVVVAPCIDQRATAASVTYNNNHNQQRQRQDCPQRVARRELLMDLHGFSRGIAYAALHVAIGEIKSDVAFIRMNKKGKQQQQKLTIITGCGAAQPDAYRLSDAVQEVLTEDFYPPIASSTVPHNTGRLVVKLACILNS